MSARIRLAEAMFPDYEFKKNTNGEWLMCPEGLWGNDFYINNAPDPENDANDCEALMLWLAKKGYTTYIAIGPFGHGVGDAFDHPLRWVDDWKARVCELAIEALKGADE